MSTKKTRLFLCLLLLVTAGVAVMSAPAAESGAVSGTVRVRGVRDSSNVVITLEGRDGAAKTSAPPSKHAVLDQQNLTFVPHVLPLVKGTAVDFPNSDKVRHNVYSPDGNSKRFNLGTYPVGVVKTVEVDDAGVVPLRCNVHSEMSAFIVALDTPYYTTSDKFGRFSIPGIPPGKYLLRAWHEKVKSVEQEVTVSAANPTNVQIEMTERK